MPIAAGHISPNPPRYLPAFSAPWDQTAIPLSVNCESPTMVSRTFREVLGDPSIWSHTATSSRHRPDMRNATIKDSFCVGNKFSLHTTSIQYGDTMSVFNIPERDLRERLWRAFQPGAKVLQVLETLV
jgi:hypothetical protein